MFPSDCHVHTHHSGDSEAPMDKVIESAIEKGLPAICITEHMDMDYPDFPELDPGTFELDTDSYHREFLSVKDKFGDRISMRFGVELGLQPQVADRNAAYVKNYPFDFVIASNHVCHRKDPYYPSFYEGRGEHAAFEEYFTSTLENIRLFDDFDVLGHLDYLVRYSPGKEATYKYEDYRDLVDEILKVLVSKGKGLDLNSKALYTKSEPPFKNPNPCGGILKRFKELGGEIITFGSDAHKPEDVAGGFDISMQIAADCGFTSYCTFAGRKPEFSRLDIR